MNKKISIVVCTKGSKTLSRCLDSLVNQKYNNYEIIVVSFQKSVKKIVSKYSKSRFFISKKANSSIQRNIGIKKSEGEIIAFIDDDAIADSNWLGELAIHHKKNVGCVGGKIEPIFLSAVPYNLKKLPTNIFRGIVGLTFTDLKNTAHLKDPFIWSCNMSVPKQVFSEIGVFDEHLGRSVEDIITEEDVDLEERIFGIGMKIVYNPKAVVRHIIGKNKLSERYFIRRSFWQGYSEIVMYGKDKRFQKLFNVKNFLLISNIARKGIVEFLFEMRNEQNLKNKIDISRKIGRLAAYLAFLEN